MIKVFLAAVLLLLGSSSLLAHDLSTPALSTQVSSSQVSSAQISDSLSIGGEVVRLDGKPLADAQVVFTRMADGGSYRCSTGADGKFQLAGLAAGSYKVEVTAPDGTRIYSSQKNISAGVENFLRLIEIGSAIAQVNPSWNSRKEASRESARRSKWLKVTQTSAPDLTLQEASRLRAKPALITEYKGLQLDLTRAIHRQEWEAASRMLQRMIEIAPEKWELYQSLGINQRYLEQYHEAIATFEKGLELLQPEPAAKKVSPEIRAAMASMFQGEGEAYFAMGDMRAAATQFRHAAELDPDPALAYVRLCSAEYNSGNDDLAIDACRKAIEADPGEIRFYQVLAGIESNAGRYNQAILSYRAGIERARQAINMVKHVSSNVNSKSSAEITGAGVYSREIGQMLFGEANAFFALKKYKEAAALFQDAAESYPAPSLAYFNRCASLYDLGDLKGAREACDQAIALDPAMADAYFAKGSTESALAVRQGKFLPHGAALAFQKYLELAPQGLYSERARNVLAEAGFR